MDMLIIDTVEKLSEEKASIEALYNEYGKTFEQSYYSLKTKLQLSNNLNIILDDSKSMLFAIKRKSGSVWQSEIESFPFLINEQKFELLGLKEILDEVMRLFNISTIYFPLVYETSMVFERLKDRFFVKKRLATSIVLPEKIKGEHLEKFINKNRNKYKKRKRLFENNLEVVELDRENTDKYIVEIENNSWKHEYGMDMKQRNQLRYYSEMIRNGEFDIVYAIDKDSKKPVAYRLDANVNGIIYQIKTSYNKNYYALMPGIYLNTINLFQSYDDIEYTYIDLYGSPNMMKQEIEEKRIDRFDMYYPCYSQEVENIARERQEYDDKFMECYLAGKGIRNMWRK